MKARFTFFRFSHTVATMFWSVGTILVMPIMVSVELLRQLKTLRNNTWALIFYFFIHIYICGHQQAPLSFFERNVPSRCIQLSCQQLLCRQVSNQMAQINNNTTAQAPECL